MSQVKYKPTVKVGDRVVVKKNPYPISASFTGEKRVQRVNWTSEEGSWIGIHADDGSQWHFHPNNYYIVRDFQVGDKVRILPTSKWYGDGTNNPADEIGKITGFLIGVPSPHPDRHGWIRVEWGKCTNVYKKCDLEYVPEVEVEEGNTMMFQKGQLVRFKDKDGYGDDDALNGDLGVVTKKYGDVVVVATGTKELEVFAERFELVSDVDIPWLRVGASVRILDNGPLYSTHIDMAQKMGLTRWEMERKLPKDYRTTPCVVVTARKHERDGSVVVAIELPNGDQYLIALRGLTVAEQEEPSKSIDTLVKEWDALNDKAVAKWEEYEAVRLEYDELNEALKKITTQLLDRGIVYTPKN